MRTLIHHSDPTNMNVCRNKKYTRYLTIKENAMHARVSLPGDRTLNFPLVSFCLKVHTSSLVDILKAVSRIVNSEESTNHLKFYPVQDENLT